MKQSWPEVVKELGAEIRRLKREKREMWKALSARCCFLCHGGNCDRDGVGKCTMSKCPLLKKGIKR
jgi:hypothetical protein